MIACPKKNLDNKEIQCPLCDKLTNRFLKAHIPRGLPKGSKRVLICDKCESIINFIVSPQKQLTLTLTKARNLIKKNKNTKIK